MTPISQQTEGVRIVDPDRHKPYHCVRYESLLLQVIAWLGRNAVGYINMGDLLDCPQAGSYPKDPRSMNDLSTDIHEHVVPFLDELERTLPRGASVDLLEGNHEDRIRRYAVAKAKDIIGLISTLPKEYALAERNRRGRCRWTWHPLGQWDSLRLGDTVFHHGFYFDQHTAASNLRRYRGCNLVQGHTHRRQYVSNGDFWSATLGHGAETKKIAHTPTPPDWEQTINLFTLYKRRGSLEQFRVNANGTCIVRGRVFKA